ncbi:MAG: DUF4230 domain-containing protein [Bacteroidota bacterium]
MIKRILLLVAMLALLFGVFWGTRYYYTWDAVSEEERSTVLLERIKTVAKLVTVEGYFSEVYDYKSYWGYDFSPFRKKALVRVKARVSVGYDLDQMKIEAQADRKRILISNLPDPEIISIDHDLDYYDLTQGTFNNFTPQDYNKINASAKELIEKQARSSDLFITAEEQSNEMLEMIRFIVEGSGWTLEFVPRGANQEAPGLLQ